MISFSAFETLQRDEDESSRRLAELTARYRWIKLAMVAQLLRQTLSDGPELTHMTVELGESAERQQVATLAAVWVGPLRVWDDTGSAMDDDVERHLNDVFRAPWRPEDITDAGWTCTQHEGDDYKDSWDIALLPPTARPGNLGMVGIPSAIDPDLDWECNRGEYYDPTAGWDLGPDCRVAYWLQSDRNRLVLSVSAGRDVQKGMAFTRQQLVAHIGHLAVLLAQHRKVDTPGGDVTVDEYSLWAALDEVGAAAESILGPNRS